MGPPGRDGGIRGVAQQLVLAGRQEVHPAQQAVDWPLTLAVAAVLALCAIALILIAGIWPLLAAMLGLLLILIGVGGAMLSRGDRGDGA